MDEGREGQMDGGRDRRLEGGTDGWKEGQVDMEGGKESVRGKCYIWKPCVFCGT